MPVPNVQVCPRAKNQREFRQARSSGLVERRHQSFTPRELVYWCFLRLFVLWIPLFCSIFCISVPSSDLLLATWTHVKLVRSSYLHVTHIPLASLSVITSVCSVRLLILFFPMIHELMTNDATSPLSSRA